MGRRAFGWTADYTAIVDAEAAELLSIARQIDADRPRKQIVRDLNDRHVATSEGNEWHVTAITRMLKNPRMIGRNADSLGRPIMQGPMVFPPVFTTPEEIELWKRVRSRLIDPRNRQPRRGELELMTGHIICGLCSGPMNPTRPRKRRPRFQCHVSTGCGRMSVQMELVENHIEHELVAHAAAVIPGASETAVATWWTSAKLDARRELLGGFLDTVQVNPVTPGFGGSSRLHLTWHDMPAWPASLVPAA